MPRAPAKIRKKYVEGTDVLCSEIEETLLCGQGVLGVAIELRALDDWKHWWGRYRSTIMAKSLEHRPGLRPTACYVCGEIPMRPVLVEPPLSHNYFRHYIPGRNGTGVWLCEYPEPFMLAEVKYLRELGIVSDAEYRAHKAWQRKESWQGGAYRLGDYVLEQGLYE